MLSLSGVELYYDHVYALKGVSIELNEGETVALIGANGAGKSSILRAITGLNKIRKGAIAFEGRRIDGLDPAAIVKLGIAMVPEGRRVFPYMSVRDNLMMGAFSRSDAAGVRASLDDVLRRFPRLKERLRQAAGTMSGGEQQMLVIGRALMAKPKLLLLDEPSLGVAPKIVQDIARSIVAINRDEKVSVLWSSRIRAWRCGSPIAPTPLTTGSVALSGASADLVKDERVQHLYLGGDL